MPRGLVTTRTSRMRHGRVGEEPTFFLYMPSVFPALRLLVLLVIAMNGGLPDFPWHTVFGSEGGA